MTTSRAMKLIQQTASLPTGRRSGSSWPAGLTAWVVWLLGLPIALLLPGIINESPLTLQGSALPLVVGAGLVGAGLLAARHGYLSAGVAAGLFAGWVALGMRTGLYGSPFSFIDGDTVRLSAMAERYTTTWHSADGIVASVPSDYPPLYPWLLGRVSVLIHFPAWRLLGLGGEILSSAAIVASFTLWRRMLTDWVALAVTLVTFGVFLQPAKPYEVAALEVTIPWVLVTFSSHPGRRLGSVAAGVIGGLLITLYQGYLMFSIFAIVALIYVGWRRCTERRHYAVHVLTVAAVSLIVSSWYLGPYLIYGLRHGLQMTDRYPDPLIAVNPFPFLTLTPVGVLTAVGLVGIVLYRGRAWWATPLLLLTLSAYIYRFLAELHFIEGGQTLVFQYTVHLVDAALAVAAVLAVARVLPALSRRMTEVHPRDIGTLAVTVVALWAGMTAYYEWMPGLPPLAGQTVNPILTSGYAPEESFLQPLPNGSYPRYAPANGRFAWFPTQPIVSDVRSILGRHAAPVTLSWSETLFATQPWPGFIGVGANAAASTEHWFSRVDALRALSSVTNAADFATASAHTPFGPINVFVLENVGGEWDWSAVNNPAVIQFAPRQFSPRLFATFKNLPDDTVIAVRRPRPLGAPSR